MPRPPRPERDDAVARARALLHQGKTEAEVRADMARVYPDVDRGTRRRWLDDAQAENAANHPGELEDERRKAIVANQRRARELWVLGFRCVDAPHRPGHETDLASVTKTAANKAAFAANNYFRTAMQIERLVADLCHWFVLPPEHDLASPEVRQLVAVMLANNADAFELGLLSEMIAALSKARDAKLDASSVIDLAARRAEIERVL